jgi:hypothetical protein
MTDSARAVREGAEDVLLLVIELLYPHKLVMAILEKPQQMYLPSTCKDAWK